MTAPVKVLIVDPGGELGGAERVADILARRADRRRFNPMVACLSRGSWPRTLAADGVPVRVVATPARFRQIAGVVSTVARLARLVRREEIEVLHGQLGAGAFYATLAGRLSGARVVWHLYDPQSTWDLRRRLFARLILLLGADHVVFANPLVASSWAPILEGSSTPTSTSLPGIDLEEISDGDPKDARELLGVSGDVPLVCMFARPEPHKQHETVVRAASIVRSRFPDCKFVLGTAWDGPDSEFVENLKTLAKQVGSEANVVLPGGVSDTTKAGLLVGSTLVVHPSSFEPYGLAILEGMAAGKPVIAADTDGARLLIEDGISGVLVPKQDHVALAEAIIALLLDPDRRERLGSAARRRAARFTVAEMVKGVEQVWEGVTSPSANGLTRPTRSLWRRRSQCSPRRSPSAQQRLLGESDLGVLGGRGVSHPGHATMPAFRGSQREAQVGG